MQVFLLVGPLVLGILLDWLLKTYVLPKKRNQSALIAVIVTILLFLAVLIWNPNEGSGGPNAAEDFSYTVRVEDANSSLRVSEAKVTIDITNGPPLDSFTDSNGIAVFTIPGILKGTRGRIIVEANSFSNYVQEITISAGLPPHLVRIEPRLDSDDEPSPETFPAEETLQRNLAANDECVITNVLVPCQVLPNTVTGAYSIDILAELLFGSGENADLYAGYIRNLIRDEFGYISVFRGDRWVVIPQQSEKIDFEYMNFYLGYERCSISRKEFPCLYALDRSTVSQNQVETYETIALFFYGHENWASCIRDANRVVYNHAVGSYEPLDITQGITLVVPLALETCISK